MALVEIVALESTPKKFSRSLLGYCVEIIKNEEVMPNQMARLACKSIQILEAKNIDGTL